MPQNLFNSKYEISNEVFCEMMLNALRCNNYERAEYLLKAKLTCYANKVSRIQNLEGIKING